MFLKKGVLRNFAKFTGKLGIDIKIVIWLFFLICPLNMPQNGTYECLQNFFFTVLFPIKNSLPDFKHGFKHNLYSLIFSL